MADFMPFSGNPLDRASNQRHDESWVQQQLAAPESRFLAFHELNVLTHHSEAPELLWLDSGFGGIDFGAQQPLLLGLRDGVAHFAVDISALTDPVVALGLDERALFAEVRGVALNLPPADAGIVAHARALLDWHVKHRYCGRCGTETLVHKAGGARLCPSCRAEHFPRTDPVVIMVVWHGDKCLLGHRAGRPAGSYSILAGFVDQAETIEEAVRREVKEEVDLDIDEVVYHASQPWPFPYTLMIGCFAHAPGDDVHTDDLEIAEARWFSREEIRDALDNPSASGGLSLPGPIAIAHHLLRDWSTAPDGA